MDGTTIAAIGGAVAGSQVLVALAQGWFVRRKTQAESGKVNADSASVLMDKTLEWASRLTARIEKLEQRIIELEATNGVLRGHIAKLEAS